MLIALNERLAGPFFVALLALVAWFTRRTNRPAAPESADESSA